jgi:anthranilate synthase component 2
MLLMLDNYDSFTYNLVQMFASRKSEIRVARNDEITIEEIVRLSPGGIVISPGPGRPEETNVCLEAIDYAYRTHTPLLGVCLGHQALAYAFGARVVRHEPVHGKTDLIEHTGTGIFAGVKNPFVATRYHSLVVDTDSLPSCLRVTAHNREGICMALEHSEAPLFGIQFHPESFMSEEGDILIENFLALTGGERHDC